MHNIAPLEKAKKRGGGRIGEWEVTMSSQARGLRRWDIQKENGGGIGAHPCGSSAASVHA